MNEFNQLIMEIKKKKLTKEMEEKFVKEYFKEEKKEKYNQLFEHYLNLVHQLAVKYSGTVNVEDLFQAGSIGLIKAFNQFEKINGRNFTAYAKQSIKSEILMEIERTQPPIKVSENIKKNIRKIKEFENEFYSEMGRKPTESEKKRELRLTDQQLLDAALLSSPLSSLEKEIKNDNGDTMTLADTIASDVDVFEEFLTEEIKEKIKEKINETLTEEEKEIIFRYHGINRKQQTAYEIAKELNKKYKQVEYLIEKAMKKLRANSKDLEDYIG